jgi:hypothetical protein
MAQLKLCKNAEEMRTLGIEIGSIKRCINESKVTAVPSKKSQPDAETPTTEHSDAEADLGGLFTSETTDPVPPCITYKPIDLSCKWTGPFPHEILDQWVRSHRKTKVRYRPLPTPHIYFRCSLQIGTSIYSMIESEVTLTKQDARNYVATMALYELAVDAMQYRLPPVYRDLWTSWKVRDVYVVDLG